MDPYTELTRRLRDLADLGAASALMSWDQETYMPPRGAARRARQRGTMRALIHSKFTDPEVGRLLDALEARDAVLNETQRAVVRETRYDFERARQLPESLVRELAESSALGVQTWQEARAESNFALFAPALTRIVDLLRRKAEAHGCAATPYDALLEDFERGMTTAALRPVFHGLRETLTPMIRTLAEAPHPPRRAALERHCEEAKQWELSLRVLADMGFDLEAGRLDKSAHPFSDGFHVDDVRLTTRIFANDVASGLFSTLHEGGHGLYEQGFHPDHLDTPLAGAPSLGLHESQSRLWENQVGRSRPFWRHLLPIARGLFPEAFGDADEEDVYRAANIVTPSLIRVEADELTYPLHIILRFELEIGLIEGTIRVDELPEAWNAMMRELLGVEPANDAEGVLQDVHWAHGAMGYFPTYALGSLYASQIWRRLREDLPGLDDEMEQGRFLGLRDWLRERIHRRGRMLLAEELIREVCGEGLNPQSFLDYAAEKFGAVYGVKMTA